MIKGICLSIIVVSTNLIAQTTIVSHNGIKYGEIVSPHTGKIWLDRNLGASKVCSALNDKKCYGNYYQWGRNADGHENSTSRTVSSEARNLDNAGKFFIKGSQRAYGDWAKKIDSGGNSRMAKWSAVDGSSICPTGYRVPTIEELGAETTDVGVNNNIAMFKNFLKFPSQGKRDGGNGEVTSGKWAGTFGNIWVNSKRNGNFVNDSKFLYYDGYDTSWGSSDRSNGFSVRCIKD